MNEEIRYTLEKLEKALGRLKEGCKQAVDELAKDGVIQRFEFSFELLWKTLRIVLGNKGLDVRAPKDIFKEAFNMGLLGDEEGVLAMLKDRNLTSHIYDKEESEQIFKRIKDKHLPLMLRILQTLEVKAK